MAQHPNSRCGHDFHHHNAQADAEAAGRVLLAMMKHASADRPSALLQKAGMVPRRSSQ
jgi:DNA polymerase III epsilon subunit-like protein